MSDTKGMSGAKRRLLERLKRGGETTTAALAGEMKLTEVAIRQHLAALEGVGLVEQRTRAPDGRGRPAILWSLTDLSQECFPERHAELTVGLIEATREAVGEEGLQRIIDARARRQVEAYRAALPPRNAPLVERLTALARRRTAEGYMAEVVQEEPGSFLLIEHHCPICDAARCCVGLCGAELTVFQQSLGSDVDVVRSKHLVSGDDRCVYEVAVRGV